MSSSQARLLTLTARQHDVELRAQKLQADKLRMANDSDKVYNTYLEALSATKIQARVYNQWEPDTFKDASLAMLEHGLLTSPTGDVAATPLFLQETGQNGSNRILVTQAIADQYGITATTQPYSGTMDDYFVEVGNLNKTNSATNPHRKVVGQHDAGGTYTDITGTVASFTPVSNGVTNTFSRTLNTTPVANSSDGVVFNDFTNTVAKIDTSSITDIMNVTSIDSNGTYKVTTKEGLQKLQTLGAIPSGVTIILGADINMSGINWTGISDFGGTFDGNGYVISNLTGTQGLFNNTKSGANIKNVGLENVNITTSSNVGGIAGNNYATIENCYVTGTITQNGTPYGTGGIVGNNNGAITDCNATINIIGDDDCTGGISGHNNATITGCNVTGSINASKGGGIVGHNTGTTVITNCTTNVAMTGISAGLVVGRGEDITKLT
ncbi:MAG: GLUG motif-containing protein, partial [Candidatus Gastranaerophilaceae bacterium]